MSFIYTYTDDIHEFFGYYNNLDEWMKISLEIKENFKYGKSIFETGYNDHIYFIALDGIKLVGVIKFKIGGQDSLRNPGFKNWICFTEVHKNYRHKGISKNLKNMLFKYCAEKGLNILSSGFTLLGHMYSLKSDIELSKIYNVEYCYRNFVEFPDFNNFEEMDEKIYKAYFKKHKGNFEEKYIVIN